MPKYKALADWVVRKERLREQILTSAGLNPMPQRCDLNVQRYGRVERGTYAVEKVSIETLSGFFLAGNLYIPLNRSGKHPGVLLPHGHWKHGRVEDLPTYSVPALGANLADQGYVAFAYDMIGYNDTHQTPHEFGGDDNEELWSFGPLGLQLWNSIRALDFLESLPEVDPERLAVTGASGGGTQTYLLAAVDDRIQVSAPVNMVSGIYQGSSDCENAPGLRVGTSNLEFAAMAAPRPMLLVSTSRDWTKNTPREEFPAVRQIYELYGKRNRVAFVQFHTEHNYDQASREAVYTFFRRHLLHIRDGATVHEVVTHGLEKPDLLIGEQLQPVGLLTFEGLFASWQRMSERQAEDLKLHELAERLSLVSGASWPTRIEYSHRGKQYTLRRSGTDDRVRAEWLKGTTAHVFVAVHPEGIEAARFQSAVLEAGRRGDSVLLVEVFAKPARYGTGGHFHTFNRSVDALRVQDVLTALSFVRFQAPGRITLGGFQSAATLCVLAAALTPERADVHLATPGVKEREVRKIPFIPGLMRAGGIDAAVKIVENRTGERLAGFHSERRAATR